jgi:lipopolysaccharide heptosyltransferase II
VNRIIIFAPNWLGDAVMALPAIRDVRQGARNATITVVARRSIAPLFDLVNEIDEVIADRDGDLLSVLRHIASPFDVAILLPNSFRSALTALRAGIKERWGYRSDLRGPLLTRAVGRAPAGTHQIARYQRLVHGLGFPNGSGEPALEVGPDVREAGARILRAAGWDGATALVALAPGAAYGSAKRWPPERFAALARALADCGVRTIMVGSVADAGAGHAVESALADSTIVLNLIGQTDVATLAGVLTLARAVVSNDSGAMHLGAALGVPVTAVFGPTDERLTAPPKAIVLSHSVWCRPCHLRTCPIDHRCMRGVQVDAVLRAARQAL